jgi:hypothetical protein
MKDKREPRDERLKNTMIFFMSKIASREIHLASRPKGIPTAANFTLAR